MRKRYYFLTPKDRPDLPPITPEGIRLIERTVRKELRRQERAKRRRKWAWLALLLALLLMLYAGCNRTLGFTPIGVYRSDERMKTEQAAAAGGIAVLWFWVTRAARCGAGVHTRNPSNCS